MPCVHFWRSHGLPRMQCKRVVCKLDQRDSDPLRRHPRTSWQACMEYALHIFLDVFGHIALAVSDALLLLLACLKNDSPLCDRATVGSDFRLETNKPWSITLTLRAVPSIRSPSLPPHRPDLHAWHMPWYIPSRRTLTNSPFIQSRLHLPPTAHSPRSCIRYRLSS